MSSEGRVSVRLRMPRGVEISTTLSSTDTAQKLFDYVVEEEGLDASTVKILGRKGKRVRPEEVIESLDTSSRLIVMGVNRATVEAVTSARSDPCLRSMDAEEERERRRRVRSERVATQHDTYKFCRFVVVERFVGGATGPHHFEALRLLHRLASDVNFLLQRYQWTVGTLVEMDPTDDRLLKKKEAEGDGACLLGYNENAGARIYVRLRADGGGFREYDDLVQTLLHELCHNAVGPHNATFFALYADLRKAYLDRLSVAQPTSRVSTLSSTRLADTKGRVEGELAREAANAAISPAERASAALVSSALNSWLPQDDVASNTTREHVDSDLIASAAERRAAQAQKRTVSTPPSETAVPDSQYSTARVAAAARRLKAMSPNARKATVDTLITILDNAALPEPRFKQIRCANKKFARTVGTSAAALDLLASVGFETRAGQTPADDRLVLTRDDLLSIGHAALKRLLQQDQSSPEPSNAPEASISSRS